MNTAVELNLALILFLPWYVLLGWIFWRMRVRGASVARKLSAVGLLMFAVFGAGLAGAWAYSNADPTSGAIWKQVFACVVGYHAYLGALLVGFATFRSPHRHQTTNSAPM